MRWKLDEKHSRFVASSSGENIKYYEEFDESQISLFFYFLSFDNFSS
jgi:hypothetical protein